MKKYLILGLILLFVVGCNQEINSFDECVAAGNPVLESYPEQCRTKDGQSFVNDQQLIGGERDEHGCLGPAGYQWNEEIKACVRVWELDEQQVAAAVITTEYVGEDYGLTVIEVDENNCQGCYTVHYSDEQVVTLENWQVVE